ncbi:hypothetical protein HX039_14515 [Myroides marinus]|uniref:HipA family kinase n=1 Tax=Myroides marinus TaxID=703342 RepID=UPI002575204E|nr:HipA family kinase [Myroides marinus]MDM1405311.1 hypothetical protein [Myroides marinus]
MIEQKDIISIIRAIPTDGHHPYLALGSDMQQYIIKPLNSRQDKVSIQKEYLCSLFLSQWSLKTPSVYSCVLPHAFRGEGKRFAYSDYVFGSKSIDPQLELNQLFSFEGKIALRRIRSKEDLVRLALFDIWIENDDRRASNTNVLMKIEEDCFDFYAIDHAFTFASLDFVLLDSAYVSFSDNDSILYSDLGQSITKSLVINELWLENMREYFYLCTTKVREQFDDIQDCLPDFYKLTIEEKEKLYSFLFAEERLKEVFSTLCFILNDIRK